MLESGPPAPPESRRAKVSVLSAAALELIRMIPEKSPPKAGRLRRGWKTINRAAQNPAPETRKSVKSCMTPKQYVRFANLLIHSIAKAEDSFSL